MLVRFVPEETDVPREVVRRVRTAEPRHIGWRGHDDALQVPELARNQGRIRQPAQPYGDIDPVLDEIGDAVRERKAHVESRVLGQECRNQRPDLIQAEGDHGADAPHDGRMGAGGADGTYALPDVAVEP